LLKLLERDVGGWGRRVEVEPVGILRLLVRRVCELLLAVVDDISPLWIYAIDVLADHFGGFWRRVPVSVAVGDLGGLDQSTETRRDAFRSINGALGVSVTSTVRRPDWCGTIHTVFGPHHGPQRSAQNLTHPWTGALYVTQGKSDHR
jgi:hypothetical protein